MLLWAIIFLSYSILTKGRFAVSFQSTHEIRDEELESIIKTAKINSQLRMMNKMVSKNDTFEHNQNPYQTDNTEENNNVLSEDNDENVSGMK